MESEPDYIIPGVNESGSPPIAPRRDRRKSSRGASLHSLADEDRTSHEADSLPSEHDRYDEEARIGTVQLNEADLEETGGYATVEKIYPTKPARPNRPKPPRPPAPARRKRLNHFFSLPRKNTHAPPTRPLRNYSTLGPSRPARRERINQTASSAALEDDYNHLEDTHGSNRDLISGAVIRKMKGRPLPAPPRPPRKTKDQDEVEEEIFDTIEEPEIGSALGALNDNVFYTQKETGAPASFIPAKDESQLIKSMAKSSKGDQEAFLVSGDVQMESEYIEEVSIATQTDPLPEDFCMDMDDEEPRPHSDACTETTDIEPTIPHTDEGRSETNSSSEANTAVTQEVNLGWMPEFSPPSVLPVVMPEISSLPPIVATVELPPTTPVAVPVDETPLTAQVAVPIMAAAPPTPVAPQVVQPAPQVVQPAPPPPPTIIEREVPVYILPDQDTVIELKAERLQVSELDVGRLNVGELSAQRILVSDIDGVSMKVSELSSKSGQLVVNGIELPPGFLQEIYDSLPRLRAATPQPEPAAVPSVPSLPPSTPQTVPEPTPPSVTEPTPPSVPEPTPPSIPPLPIHIPMSPMYSFIPSAMRVPRSSVQDMDSEEEMISFIPATPRRRRHQHHVSKPVSSRYSSDEEEEVVSFQPRRQGVEAEPSVGQLGRQLITAVQASSIRAMRTLLQYTASQLEGEDKRRELQTALCILLVLVAGLILMGFGVGKTSHHHHWDYFNPPNN